MANYVIGAPTEHISLIDMPSSFQHVLSLRIWTLNRRIAAGTSRYSRHEHACYEIIIPLKGGYSCMVNGCQSGVIEPGSYLLIQPGDSHEDFYEPGLEFLAILFYLVDMTSKHWPGTVLKKGEPAQSYVFPLRPESKARRLLPLIAEASPAMAKDPVMVLSLESLCESFFWSLFLEMPEAMLSPEFTHCLGEDAFRLQAISFFDGQRGGSLDIKLMAESLKMSRRALFYKFNSAFGRTPERAYTAWRVAKAATLIEAGMSVKSVAEKLGFADQFHFSKVFKREQGFPPSTLHLRQR